jgi:beta-lactamase superfamily II metal-dependent hydrolase
MSPPELYGDNIGVIIGSEGRSCGAEPSREPDQIRLHFIDVGQGDAIWIETADDGDDGNGVEEGLHILIDVGDYSYGDNPNGGQVVADYLAAHGRPSGTTIDYLVVTHAHSDHYGGAQRIFELYDVLNVVDPGFDNDASSLYWDFLYRAEDEVDALGGRLYRPLVGDLIPSEYSPVQQWGEELNAIILNSESDLRLGEGLNDQVNNTSIVIHLTYGGTSILLMGDAQEEVELDLLDEMPGLRVNILKVGHHGSQNASSAAFLEMIFNGVLETRRAAVIQSGRKDFSGVQLPTLEVWSRLQEYIPSDALFSTEYNDDGLEESEAANGDHVLMVVDSEGSITACYFQ